MSRACDQSSLISTTMEAAKTTWHVLPYPRYTRSGMGITTSDHSHEMTGWHHCNGIWQQGGQPVFCERHVCCQGRGVWAEIYGNTHGAWWNVQALTLPKPLHKEVLGAPIHSIDWSGHHLLVGTNQGVTKLFSVVFEHDQMQDFSLIGQYDNSLSEVWYSCPKIQLLLYTVHWHTHTH